MKILQVNCVYQKGSTGKIIYDIHKCLKTNGINSVVCYGRGELIRGISVYKFCSELESKIFHLLNKFGWLMYSVCPIATRSLIRIINRENPDVVHLHCINGYCVNVYRLLKFLGKSNIKTIITHHAEFFYTGNCGHAFECIKYTREIGCKGCPQRREATGAELFDFTNIAWKLMKNAFSCFKKENLILTAVSPWVLNRSSFSPICNGFECKFVPNGVETNVFKLAPADEIQDIKNRLPSPERRIILHVSANFTTDKNNIKGGYYIKKLAEIMSDYQFVIVASNIGKIEHIPDNMYIWGSTKSQNELAALYSAANLSVIASKRETFSMIVAESLCCGTPIVGFKAGGPESIAMSEYSKFVEYGNIDELKAAVEVFLEKEFDRLQISAAASAKYSKEVMTSNYMTAYRDILLSDNIAVR